MKIKTLLLALMVMISFMIPYPGSVLAQNASPFSDLLCRTDIRPNTSVRETSSHLLTRHYALSDLKQQPTELGLQFKLPGCETLQIPNCPAFPFEKITITLNPGETITSLKILSLIYDYYHQKSRIQFNPYFLLVPPFQSPFSSTNFITTWSALQFPFQNCH